MAEMDDQSANGATAVTMASDLAMGPSTGTSNGVFVCTTSVAGKAACEKVTKDTGVWERKSRSPFKKSAGTAEENPERPTDALAVAGVDIEREKARRSPFQNRRGYLKKRLACIKKASQRSLGVRKKTTPPKESQERTPLETPPSSVRSDALPPSSPPAESVTSPLLAKRLDYFHLNGINDHLTSSQAKKCLSPSAVAFLQAAKLSRDLDQSREVLYKEDYELSDAPSDEMLALTSPVVGHSPDDCAVQGNTDSRDDVGKVGSIISFSVPILNKYEDVGDIGSVGHSSISRDDDRSLGFDCSLTARSQGNVPIQPNDRNDISMLHEERKRMWGFQKKASEKRNGGTGHRITSVMQGVPANAIGAKPSNNGSLNRPSLVRNSSKGQSKRNSTSRPRVNW